jgi:hypothetical protein
MVPDNPQAAMMTHSARSYQDDCITTEAPGTAQSITIRISLDLRWF